MNKNIKEKVNLIMIKSTIEDNQKEIRIYFFKSKM